MQLQIQLPTRESQARTRAISAMALAPRRSGRVRIEGEPGPAELITDSEDSFQDREFDVHIMANRRNRPRNRVYPA
jgi:hypothetical protein